MFGLFSRQRSLADSQTAVQSLPRTPPNMRIYAIGDIHGRYDLLRQLQRMIWNDVAQHRKRRKVLVYLGDYIDRGPDSRKVLERLSRHPLHRCVSVHLMGNHEQAMLGFMQEPDAYSDWLVYGGLATLSSYGITNPRDEQRSRPLPFLAQQLESRVPEHHKVFLRGLKKHIVLGDYLFVHAGIRPRVPLKLQTAGDLLWIRDDFLRFRQPHSHFVVHGHHMTEIPDVHANRIGIDTGAFATGCLTCLVLDDESRSFIDTR